MAWTSEKHPIRMRVAQPVHPKGGEPRRRERCRQEDEETPGGGGLVEVGGLVQSRHIVVLFQRSSNVEALGAQQLVQGLGAHCNARVVHHTGMVDTRAPLGGKSRGGSSGRRLHAGSWPF